MNQYTLHFFFRDKKIIKIEKLNVKPNNHEKFWSSHRGIHEISLYINKFFISYDIYLCTFYIHLMSSNKVLTFVDLWLYFHTLWFVCMLVFIYMCMHMLFLKITTLSLESPRYH